MATSSNTFLRAFHSADLCENDTPIIAVGENDSIARIFTALTEHKILSVPVWNNRTGKYSNFVDILDILVYAVKVIGDDQKKAAYETFRSHGGFDIKCAKLADISRRNPFVTVEESMSLHQIIQKMNARNVHRVATINSAGQLKDIISQSSIVKFMASHEEENAFASKTVQSLQLGYRDVVTVRRSQTCFFAFQTMVENQISGVAVLNEEGEAISHISASDIKKLGYDDYLLSNIFLSVDKYLDLNSPQSSLPPIISVSPSATVQEVIEKFKLTKFHRIYVIDNDPTKLLGVITLTDILLLFE